jgi:hypothetical protein
VGGVGGRHHHHEVVVAGRPPQLVDVAEDADAGMLRRTCACRSGLPVTTETSCSPGVLAMRGVWNTAPASP